jgi:ferredoxin-NADP reductase
LTILLGTDATAAFEAMYHSSRARGILEGLKIGELDEKSKNSAGSLLNPYAAGALRPGTAKGSGPYGLGAYNPKQPTSRLGGPMTTPQRPAIDEMAWRRYELLAVTKINHDTSLFRFQIPHKSRLNVGMGKHLALGVTLNGKMIKREYTPITDESGYFEILVKKYDGGPVSNHIHGLKIGDGALMRGLYGLLQVKPNHWSHLYMFAAGTGIAPMMPFIRYFATIASKEATETQNTSQASQSQRLPKIAQHMHLVFANKTIEDILLKFELDKYVAIGNRAFTIDYLLSRESGATTVSPYNGNTESIAPTVDTMSVDEKLEETVEPSPIVSPALQSTPSGRISASLMESLFSRSKFAFKESTIDQGPLESTFALICGPDGFVDAVKVLLTSTFHFSESNYHAF